MKSFMRKAFALSFVALAWVATAPSAFAVVDMVVVHVVNAPFKPGTIIDGSQPLKLEAGWSVTLVAADGSFVTLKGPSDRVPAKQRSSRSGDPKLIEALRALLAAEEISTAALGVVRSANGETSRAALPDAWAVNVFRSGSRCIRHRVVTLWRDDAVRSANLRIRSSGGGRMATTNWPAGHDLLKVDGAGFRDGGRYLFDVDGRRVDITMHVMPRGLTRLAEQAAWMAESGCREQALTLLQKVR